MRHYAILKRYPDAPEILIEYVEYNDEYFIVNVLKNEDKHINFKKVEAFLELRMRENIESYYAMVLPGFMAQTTHYNFEFGHYDIKFDSESDEDALLAFELQ